MPATLTTLDAVLKEFYIGPIRAQIPQNSILLTRLRRNETNISGKEAYVPLWTAENSGIGARAESGALPTAGSQEYNKALYTLAYNYGSIKISGPAIKAASSNKGAFLQEADAEIKGLTSNMKNDLNRQLHGDGSGVLGLLNGDPSSGTTVTMDNPSAMYIKKGMVVDFVDPSSTTKGDKRANCAGLVVSAKTAATTWTCSTTVHADAADNDYVVRAGSYGLEMMGLKGIINDSNPRAGLTLGGINRSTAGNEFWKANVLSNSSTNRKLTLDLMQQAWDLSETQDGEISLILTSADVRRKYLALVKADGRFVNNLDMDGGFTGLDYNGKPLVVDRHCLPNKIFFVDESTLQIYQMSDLEWMQDDKGAVLSKVSGYDLYEAYLTFYSTLGCDCPSKNTLLDDISTT